MDLQSKNDYAEMPTKTNCPSLGALSTYYITVKVRPKPKGKLWLRRKIHYIACTWLELKLFVKTRLKTNSHNWSIPFIILFWPVIAFNPAQVVDNGTGYKTRRIHLVLRTIPRQWGSPVLWYSMLAEVIFLRASPRPPSETGSSPWLGGSDVSSNLLLLFWNFHTRPPEPSS